MTPSRPPIVTGVGSVATMPSRCESHSATAVADIPIPGCGDSAQSSAAADTRTTRSGGPSCSTTASPNWPGSSSNTFQPVGTVNTTGVENVLDRYLPGWSSVPRSEASIATPGSRPRGFGGGGLGVRCVGRRARCRRCRGRVVAGGDRSRARRGVGWGFAGRCWCVLGASAGGRDGQDRCNRRSAAAAATVVGLQALARVDEWRVVVLRVCHVPNVSDHGSRSGSAPVLMWFPSA